MVRLLTSVLILFFFPLQAYACNCYTKGVIPISEMLDRYDHVFLAQVDDAIDYNDNRWPVGWNKELDYDELQQRMLEIRPTKLAKITISEVFKGPLRGTEELRFKADSSNCAGGYYSQGETTLFFLNDVGDSFVRAAGWCSASSQYLYETDQVRDYFVRGTDVNVISRDCYRDFRSFGQNAMNVFKGQNCAEHYDEYKAGKLFIPHQQK